MERNGDARKKPTQIQSTVKDTCIEAKTVQESLWKLLLQQYQSLQQQHQTSHQSPRLTPLLFLLFLPCPCPCPPPSPNSTTINFVTLVIIPRSIIPLYIPMHQDLLGLGCHLKKTPPTLSWIQALTPRQTQITGSVTKKLEISTVLVFFCFLYISSYSYFYYLLTRFDSCGVCEEETVTFMG